MELCDEHTTGSENSSRQTDGVAPPRSTQNVSTIITASNGSTSTSDC